MMLFVQPFYCGLFACKIAFLLACLFVCLFSVFSWLEGGGGLMLKMTTSRNSIVTVVLSSFFSRTVLALVSSALVSLHTPLLHTHSTQQFGSRLHI
jgi:hypothetical protein